MRRRRGTILIVVLLILAALAGMALVIGRSARVEVLTSSNYASGAKAAEAERGAEQYVITMLASDRQGAMQQDQSQFANVPVGDAGVFWIIRPNYGDNDMPVYGLVDEASKINLNSNVRGSGERVEMIQNFPLMTRELAYSIGDWRDSDSNVGGGSDGAEDTYYLALPNPYHCKNSNFESVEEILLVKGAFPELLYGDGVTGVAAANYGAGGIGSMSIGGLSEQDLRARGMFNYLTAYSTEPAQNNNVRRGRININTATREVLACLPGLTPSDADTLCSRRGTSGFGGTDTSWVAEALGPKAAALDQWIVGQSYQFSADIVAASSDGRAFKHVRIVLDASVSGNPPKVIYRKDLTEQGWPLPQDVLTALRTTGVQNTGISMGRTMTSSSSAR
jgi:type II secretory pathway component PulK